MDLASFADSAADGAEFASVPDGWSVDLLQLAANSPVQSKHTAIEAKRRFIDTLRGLVFSLFKHISRAMAVSFAPSLVLIVLTGNHPTDKLSLPLPKSKQFVETHAHTCRRR